VTLDVLRRRNRLRIVATLVLATLFYWLAVCAAAITVGLLLFLRVVVEGDLPDDLDDLKWLGIFALVVIVLAVILGSIYAAFTLPRRRAQLERRVLAETGARVVDDTNEEHRRVRNLLEGLAIAAHIPPPRFAVVGDAAPNSFAVGTRPKKVIVAVTQGAIDKLARDELEAILAYEVSRIGSFDVALSSWTVALTSAAISEVDDDGAASIIGWLPYKASVWLQGWALRDSARDRDRAAVQFTRNPVSLIDALEALRDDSTQIHSVTRATAPLWIEVPAADGTTLLDGRIAALREIAGLEPESPQEQPQ
jgi:heat shock protein HtpX